MRRPVNSPYVITTEFGVADSYSRFGKHAGVDYAVGHRAQIFAPVSGTVTTYTWTAVHGNVVQIKADDGLYHRLLHNDSVIVRPGQRVTEGQVVAYAGTTGLSTGVHCHWDIATVSTPTDFAQFKSPASLLFAGSAPKVDYVFLPGSVSTWAVYRVGSKMVKYSSDHIGYLLPSRYGGLKYAIVGRVNNGVIIDTQAYGRVQIWTANTEAVIS